MLQAVGSDARLRYAVIVLIAHCPVCLISLCLIVALSLSRGSSYASVTALRPRRRRRIESQKSGTESPEIRRDMIWTPDVTRVCSKRAFDGLVCTYI